LINERHTETGGAFHHVFGLMPFLGYRFAGRLRDIKKCRLHMLWGEKTGPLLSRMVGDPIAHNDVAAVGPIVAISSLDPNRGRHGLGDTP
jgi:TnpA family transposase